MTERVTRAQRYEQILALKREGLTVRQIGERLGVTASGVRAITTDPDGSKQRARRVRYQGVCAECGDATDGSNGAAKASVRCRRCAQGFLTEPTVRRPVPVRLCDLPLDLRLAGVREANRIEKGEQERLEILLAAIHPSETVYYVSERARPMLEAAA